MAGKNAKRRAKVAKTESMARALEMPKSLWGIVASAATLAGASGGGANRCRHLAAKAEYYAGEPENAAGQVRGDLTGEEMKTFRALIRQSKEATPQGQALAEALRQLDGLELMEGAACVISEPRGQARQDAVALYHPMSLKTIISMLDMVIGMMGNAGASLSDVGPAYLQTMTRNLASVRAKLAAAREVVVNTGGPPPMMFTCDEAETVASALRQFLETFRFNAVPGQGVGWGRVSDDDGGVVRSEGMVPLPESAQHNLPEKLDDVRAILECAARYFTRKAKP